jgi:hypothetical protein
VTTLYADLDFTAFFRNLERAAQDLARSVDTMADAMRRAGLAFARAKEVKVSGLEARVYVRAGLDPTLSTPAELHRLVRLLLHRPHVVVGVADSMFLDRPARVRLAVAAMRGWAVHRG